MKKRLQRVARDAAVVSHDLLYVVGFVTGSRRLANIAHSVSKIERRFR